MKKFMLFIVGLLAYGTIASDSEATKPITVLHQINKLIKSNNVEDLRSILETQTESSEVLNRTYLGLSPLHYALLKDKPNSEIVQILLDNGANPNQALEFPITYFGERSLTMYRGWTAMHIAVQCYARQEILQLLFDARGKFFKKDQEGWRPVDLAFHAKNSITAIKFLIETVIRKEKLSNIKFKRARKTEHYKKIRRKNFPNLIFHFGEGYFTISCRN